MNRQHILSFFILALAVMACSKDYDSPTKMEPLPAEEALSVKDIDLLPTGDMSIFTITSQTPWDITGIPSWITVSPTSGKSGSTTISVVAKINDTRKDRDAVIMVNRQDYESIPVKISQPFPYLEVSTHSLSFTWENSRYEKEGVALNQASKIIKIKSNIEWEFRSKSSTKLADDAVDLTNFAIDSLSGFGDTEMHFLPTKVNFSKDPYDFVIELVPVVTDGDKRSDIDADAVDWHEIKLHQDNLRFLINGSADDGIVHFNELNDDPNINLTIDAEIPWVLTQCPEWVRTAQSGKGVQSINFIADGANPTTIERQGVVRLSPQDVPEAYREIHISQDAYVFTVDKTDFNKIGTIENDDVSEKTITLQTTGTWAIDNIPEWLSVEPSSCNITANEMGGKRTHVISVKAKSQNLELEDLDALLTIKSTQSGNELYETCHAKQDKFVFDLTYDNRLLNLPTMNKDKYDVSVSASGRWEFVNKPDWIDISQVNSDVPGSTTLTIGPNCGNPDLTKDRTATLTLKSLNHEAAGKNLTRTIEVKQRKYSFEITVDNDLAAIPAYKSQYSYNLNLKCSADWIISECPSWLKASVTSGTGEEDLNIALTPEYNTAKISRSGILTIRSLYNNEEKSFAVKQDAFVFDNSTIVYPEVAVMNDRKYTVSFDLTDEVPWSLQFDSWLSPSLTSGKGSATIDFTPQPNPDLYSRSAKAYIVIGNGLSNEKKEISFAQEKYEFDSSPESFSYSELTTKQDAITVLCSGPWVIDNRPSWVSFSSTSGNTSGSFVITPSNNVQTSPRSASFNVRSTLNNLTKTVTLTQDAYVFDAKEENKSYNTLETRTDEIDVTSSGKWSVKDLPSWMTASKMSGNGALGGLTESLTISSTENLTEQDRSAVIRITSDDNASLVKKVSVSQSKFDFRVDNTAFSYETPVDIDTKTINITCPSDWTASVNKTWVTLSDVGGTGNGSITATPSKNLTEQDRTAEITITSTKNDLKRIVTISQPKFLFDVDKSKIAFASPISSENSPVAISIVCSDEWEVSSDVPWLTISDYSGKGNKEITVSTNSNNLTSTAKIGKLSIRSILNGWVREIEIVLPKFSFDVSPDEIVFNSSVAEECTAVDIIVDCSSEWTVYKENAWISISKTSGTKTSVVSVRPESDNTSNVERTGKIIITSTLTGESKNVKITQPANQINI